MGSGGDVVAKRCGRPSLRIAAFVEGPVVSDERDGSRSCERQDGFPNCAIAELLVVRTRWWQSLIDAPEGSAGMVERQGNLREDRPQVIEAGPDSLLYVLGCW